MKAKNDYTLRMTNKLNSTKAAPETYWLISIRFLYNKKIPAISPLLVKGKFVLDFCTKANLFNDFLTSICKPVSSGGIVYQHLHTKPTLELILLKFHQS